jgi:multimeric flavodoxin WrbA
MAPKIIALLGSPLAEGNTALLLNKAVEGARKSGCEVTVIHVPTLEFTSCMEFYFCRDHEACMMEDDVSRLIPAFREMQSLIIATPVMTMGIPGHLKSFMDRFQVFYCAKYERKKPLIEKELRKKRRTLFISISGMNLPDNFDGVKKTTQAFCDIIDCRYADELLIPDMDTRVDLNRFPDILDSACKKGYALGSALN